MRTGLGRSYLKGDVYKLESAFIIWFPNPLNACYFFLVLFFCQFASCLV